MAIRKGELGEAYQPPPPPPSDQTTLNVALYPYVPSLNAFVSAVQVVWQQLRPDVTLNFVFYDPYKGPPAPTLDVFAFDCIYVDDLVATGSVDRIAASEIQGYGDLMGVGLANAAIDPGAGTYAGIPYLGCTAVLYYRKGDPQLDNSTPLGIDELLAIVGTAQYPGPQPPRGEGLMMDLGGKTTDACTYASLWRQAHHAWWPKPFPMGELENDVFAELRNYALMAGRAQALYKDPGHDRTNWFAAGYGRALVGLTETMSGWNPDTIASLGFRPLPIAATGDPDYLMLYADAVGIRPGLGDRRATAVLLANVIASQQVVQAAISPVGSGAQYLIPARVSVIQALAERLPVYAAIWKMLGSFGGPTTFRLGPGMWKWAPLAGQKIISALFPVTEEEPAPEEPVPVPGFRHGYEHTPAGLWRRER